MGIYKKLILTIISLLALSICLFYYGTRPKYNGRVFNKYPKYGKVEIFRDEYGIPHIYGKNYVSAVYGLGFAQG